MEKDPFIEYSKETEPSKRDKCYAWKTAIGLQDVDGLKTSDYLIETAKRNIEGDITIDEVQGLLVLIMKKMAKEPIKTEHRKPIMFRQELLSSYRKKLLALLLPNISLYIKNYLPAYMTMRV